MPENINEGENQGDSEEGVPFKSSDEITNDEALCSSLEGMSLCTLAIFLT